jgi:hypothetical protein
MFNSNVSSASERGSEGFEVVAGAVVGVLEFIVWPQTKRDEPINSTQIRKSLAKDLAAKNLEFPNDITDAPLAGAVSKLVGRQEPQPLNQGRESLLVAQ